MTSSVSPTSSSSSSLLSSVSPRLRDSSNGLVDLDASSVLPQIVAHPKAPLFSEPDGLEVFTEILSEVSTGNFPSTEVFMSILRQAGLVNLFFFEKYILGAAGPYSGLTPTLHQDICNFRQMCLEPGSRGALILSRGAWKSTAGSHGADTWELVRNPDLRIGIFSYPQDRATEFFLLVKANFDSNPFLKELYPEYVPNATRGSRWNDTEIVLPNRTMLRQEASCTPYTAGGATQGIHLDVGNFDDIVGDSMLNVDRAATADLIKMTHWFEDNQNTVLDSPELSRLFFCFTRYSPQDPGESVMLDTWRRFGDWYNVEDRYPVNPKGKWMTYYRSARKRDRESVFPEKFSKEFLDNLEATKPITYRLNYANDPYLPEIVEFDRYTLGDCELGWDPVASRWILRLVNEGKSFKLSECYLSMAIDPAASEKFKTMRTSRTCVLLMAHTPEDQKCVVGLQVGYARTTQWFDWIFSYKETFGDLLAITHAELQAGFKSLEDIMRVEQSRRGVWVNFRGISALGEKETTIRNILQPQLERGLIYAVPRAKMEILKELKIFPSGSGKDILDTLKIAVKMSRKPEEGESFDSGEDPLEESSPVGRKASTGY